METGLSADERSHDFDEVNLSLTLYVYFIIYILFDVICIHYINMLYENFI